MTRIPAILADVLKGRGIRLTPLEVADAVWLASRLVAEPTDAERELDAPREPAEDEGPAPPVTTDHSPIDKTGADQTGTDKPGGKKESAPAGDEPASQAEAADLLARGTEAAGDRHMRGRLLAVPDAPLVPHMLALERALRPLARRVPSRRFREIDEEGTVDYIARTGLRTVVTRPRRERGLEGVLVYERSPTMRLWHDVARALHGLFWRTGAFAWLDFALLDTADGAARLVSPADADRRRDPRSACRPGAARRIFFCTDCLSDGWLSGKVPRIVDDWAKHHPTVVLQMLPHEMWDGTSLRQARGGEPASRAGRFVPVVPILSSDLADFSHYLAGMSGTGMTGYSVPPEAFDERGDLQKGAAASAGNEPPTPAEMLAQFTESVSAQTLDLARSLAAAPLFPPVMRLMQYNLVSDSELAHVAELFNSGLIRRCSPHVPNENPNRIEYDFVAGVRDLLLAQGSLDRVKDVWSTLDDYLNAKLGRTFDFSAILDDPSSAEFFPSSQMIGAPTSFGRIFKSVLLHLGGEFAEVATRPILPAQPKQPPQLLLTSEPGERHLVAIPSDPASPILSFRVQRIGLADVEEILGRARAENWRELALLGPAEYQDDSVDESRVARLIENNWDPEHVFVLREFMTVVPTSLTSLRSLQSLDLSRNYITALPPSFGALTSLVSLNLGFNYLDDFGARAISALTSLTSLNMECNRLDDKGIRLLARLTPLTSLILRNNEVGDAGVPALTSLNSLASLDLRNNRVGDNGAIALAGSPSLISLNLANNHIGDDGARALASLPSLASLDLASNEIGDTGASALAARNSLTSLDLCNNWIGDAGARALASLPLLSSLDLNDNLIGIEGCRAILEAWLASMARGKRQILDLRHNDGLEKLLPAEALNTDDARAVLAAYRRRRDEQHRSDVRPLNEARIFVVGDVAVGMTLLNQSLIHDRRLRPNEAPKGMSSWRVGESGIQVHFRDFGIREIFHGIHEIFFTDRSLYLLVLELGLGDRQSDLEWLQTIRRRAPNSPVIVAINKFDNDPSRMSQDEARIRREFPNVVAIVRTSSFPAVTSLEPIAALRELIIRTLETDERLKHVRNPVPVAWLAVKERVAELAHRQPTLDRAEFKLLCRERDITDTDEQRSLRRVLHDLGTIVDFDAVLLLDPHWLTTAIYRTITYADDATRDLPPGEIRRSDLQKCLPHDRYDSTSGDYNFILEAMSAVELCFELPGEQPPRYLIPEALPTDEPALNYSPDSLRFRYAYDRLPRGLIPQFIVLAHNHLTKEPVYWRSGVVLRVADCQVLVRASFTDRRVDILTTGPLNRRREALSVVVNYLEQLHFQIPGLGARALVPLPDQPEINVSYELLLKMERLHGPDFVIYPDGAARDAPYTLRELLQGVRQEPGSFEAARPLHAKADRESHGATKAEAKPPARAVASTDQVDFLIITSLPETCTTILKQLPGHHEIPLLGDDFRIAYAAQLVAASGDADSHYSLVILPYADVGSLAAIAAHAIARLKPRYVLVTGIAAGFAEEGVKLGDVLVADKIVYFDLPKGRNTRTKIHGHSADKQLLAAAREFHIKSWMKPPVRFGSIGTQDEMVARARPSVELKPMWPNLIGFEMAGDAVIASAKVSPHKPGLFMIHCVSELADGDYRSKATARRRSEACEIAANFTIAFLKSMPVPPAVRDDSTKPPTTGVRATSKTRTAIQRHNTKYDAELKRLQGIKEHELILSFVVPLLRAMGYDIVEYNGGPYEKGRDLICTRADTFGGEEITVVQLKKYKPSAKSKDDTSFAEISSQISQALETEIPRLGGHTQIPSRVIFITPYIVDIGALESRFAKYKGLRARGVTVIDGYALAALLETYCNPLFCELVSRK